jgi:MFS family permease
MLILASTLVSYVLSITLAENHGMSRTVISLIVATIIGIILFIAAEKKTEVPLVHLDMFKNAVFSVSLIISVILYATVNGYGFILPFYFEQAKFFSTSLAGIVMMAGPVGCALFTPVAGGAASRFGNAKVMTFGILMIAIGVFFMSNFGLHTSVSTIAITLFLCNGCLAFFQTPNNAFIMTLAKPEQRGLTSGILNLSRTIGQTTGTAVIGAIFYFFTRTNSMKTGNSQSIVIGMSHTFLVEVLIMTCALLLGLIAYRPWDTKKVY